MGDAGVDSGVGAFSGTDVTDPGLAWDCEDYEDCSVRNGTRDETVDPEEGAPAKLLQVAAGTARILTQPAINAS